MASVPPQTIVELVHEPIEGDVSELVRHPSAGAVAIFLGTTRDHFERKEVVTLHYEAYEDMARQTLLGICDEIRAQWSVHSIAIVHKLGDCPVGATSVAIAISSEHRLEGLEAVHWCIDELKRRVPIWKKETYASGDRNDSEWKRNAEFNTKNLVDRVD